MSVGRSVAIKRGQRRRRAGGSEVPEERVWWRWDPMESWALDPEGIYGNSWSCKAVGFIDASLSLACSPYAVLHKRGSGGSAGTSPNLISQEQLVRKAASLCYLLSNEGTIALVSEQSFVLPVLFLERFCENTSHLCVFVSEAVWSVFKAVRSTPGSQWPSGQHVVYYLCLLLGSLLQWTFHAAGRRDGTDGSTFSISQIQSYWALIVHKALGQRFVNY